MPIADLLGQLMNAHAMPPHEADERFDQLAGQAEPDLLGEGVAEAFHSDRTPPFPDMVGQMFGQAAPQQRAGMLNQILAAVGPAILAGGAGGILGRVLQGGGGMGSVGGAAPGGMGGLGGAGGGALGAVLGSVLGGAMAGGADPRAGGWPGGQAGGAPNGVPQVTPEQAAQITPEEMREIAAQAQQQQPGVVEQLSGFAARNPQLVKVLGGVAMALIASRMSQRVRG